MSGFSLRVRRRSEAGAQGGEGAPRFGGGSARWRGRLFRLARGGLLLLGAVGALARESAPADDPLAGLRDWLARPRAERPALDGQPFAALPLTREQAKNARSLLWADHAKFIRETRAAEMRARVIELDGRRMKFETLSFPPGKPPGPKPRSLFLSLHGGGGAPHAVNESQWRNQVRLGLAYRPREGLYVAPRAPTDAWNLWHQAHIDAFFDRLIENLIVLSNVNPNRVYLLGYSAGGDGVYQLAPRMADRWAAAAMMAGHPNDASPLGLRNVPFAIQVGALDRAFHRNEVAAGWGRKLDALHRADPGGYRHFLKIYPGKGHWMDLQDRRAIPWMEQFTRHPLPDRVVWHQDDVVHTRLYWLAVPREEARAGQDLVAERHGQEITLRGKKVRRVMVLLNDALLDLDQPVTLRAGGKTLFHGRVPRTVTTLERTLRERGDPDLVFSAEVSVTLPAASASDE